MRYSAKRKAYRKLRVWDNLSPHPELFLRLLQFWQMCPGTRAVNIAALSLSNRQPGTLYTTPGTGGYYGTQKLFSIPLA